MDIHSILCRETEIVGSINPAMSLAIHLNAVGIEYAMIFPDIADFFCASILFSVSGQI